MESYNHYQMERAICLLLESEGFETAEKRVIACLSEYAERYIERIGRVTSRFAESNGRNAANALDVMAALDLEGSMSTQELLHTAESVGNETHSQPPAFPDAFSGGAFMAGVTPLVTCAYESTLVSDKEAAIAHGTRSEPDVAKVKALEQLAIPSHFPRLPPREYIVATTPEDTTGEGLQALPPASSVSSFLHQQWGVRCFDTDLGHLGKRSTTTSLSEGIPKRRRRVSYNDV